MSRWMVERTGGKKVRLGDTVNFMPRFANFSVAMDERSFRSSCASLPTTQLRLMDRMLRGGLTLAL